MRRSRRCFLLSTASALGVSPLLFNQPLFAAAPAKLRLGACDWSLRVNGPEALATGKKLGLDGVEISPGPPADTLAIATPETQAAYKQAEQETGVKVSSIALGLLNDNPLATDPRAPAWLEQAIATAKALDAPVILVAFFGKGDLLEGTAIKAKEMDAAVERIKAAARLAEKAGVTLGLENYLSANDNLAMLDRIQSNAVRVYYDVCNSTNKGYNVPEELRMLKDLVCQIHLKDNKALLGQGDVDMPGVHDALEAIEYKGWLILETPILNNDMMGSFSKNALYSRNLFGI
ncbi:MAG: sugar phosphate isomerase/epimerase [Candidatus Hydrogenedentes bacterium]|nr:sugar phosphate isomerase/epimerase [Candidatus Hydrogenedentota bacterium]